MRVIYDPDYCGQGPELYLERNSDEDCDTLERLLAECVTRGHGRHPISMAMLHVRIALTPNRSEQTKDMGDC